MTLSKPLAPLCLIGVLISPSVWSADTPQSILDRYNQEAKTADKDISNENYILIPKKGEKRDKQ